MPCFAPVRAYRSLSGGVTFSPAMSMGQIPITVPCGQCRGCRLAKAMDWQTRCVHEAQMHDVSSFVNLTYAEEHLPYPPSVRPDHLRNFMKRLRKRLWSDARTHVRFFSCGEYGGKRSRPHYHVLLFGFGFPDRYFWRMSGAGFPLYRSPTLEKCWQFGHSEVGTVTPQSAGYVARYNLKKVNGDAAKSHYGWTDPATGELHELEREFIRMSNRPGIGSAWFDRFKGDAFPSDFVVVDGARRQVPRYYTKRLAEEEALAVLGKRKVRARAHAANNTPERLAVRDECLRLRLERLEREYEE